VEVDGELDRMLNEYEADFGSPLTGAAVGPGQQDVRVKLGIKEEVDMQLQVKAEGQGGEVDTEVRTKVEQAEVEPKLKEEIDM
jgi:hypothetical protein